MFNFQMDNVLSLHNLIGTQKQNGITPLGRFKKVDYLQFATDVIKDSIDNKKDNIAIGKNGMIYYESTTQKVLWKTFPEGIQSEVHKVTDLSWSFDVCQLYPTKKGFIGIYKNDSSTKTQANYTLKIYDENGGLVGNRLGHITIPQDASGSLGAYIDKVVQDPVTEQFVFIFSSYATDATYLLVMDGDLNKIIKSTFVEKQYSLYTKNREYMAYNGWLYGTNKANTSHYSKMKYNTQEDVSVSFSSIYMSYANAAVSDTRIGLAYDIVDGIVYDIDKKYLVERTPVLGSDGSEHLACISSSPNPENGFIIASHQKRLFEVNFKVPKIDNKDEFPIPEVRIVTDIRANSYWNNVKCFLSYDGKTFLAIYYDSNREGVTKHSLLHLFRR